MTIHRKRPAEPEPVRPAGRHAFRPSTAAERRGPARTAEPYDRLAPEYPDRCWLPRRPEDVVVVDELRGRWPDQPLSLAEALEARPTCTRDPEPDLEAEP